MSADRAAIENALQQFVSRSSGILGTAVIWGDQTASRPTGIFADLRLSSDSTVGLSEEREEENPDATGGSEILLSTDQDAEISLSVEIRSPHVTGNSSATSLLAKVRNALDKDSELNSFEIAGLAYIDKGPVQNLSALLETSFESRASLDIRFRFNDGTSETTTFIESVVLDEEP